ncbi:MULTISPECIES: bifunctional diguanylate cyclase/phosphodiesterase [unclassified Pseudomonas]|uniref:putative bifunctional diguanylate cyclase/phosphodiesterase n=1 Tax=unclassified Pseudomonas TaxID=196821 RepID=UPI000871A483|nr:MULTISPECIES: GGDEF and EAL domain-containing protein [unclassified Pseudomonas]SCW60285.1 diguanylate cyclase (GGDEF) domain-containing protein [Pseudomonas sp. NFACC05-1]SCZ36942.1 diguanylate cyclase (GGDEF) domain-containing protein [Pseudomonas sp. NFACC44-2]SDA61625.1 diguanylate cyclase (GGDEF) domain-containing protein [Pseudomonas sp. NFACC51]SDX51711.1 diguanylate cyclase (GGDEF) domain-containing protein [Pseudomonas sp. NFACC08-1]SEJ15565.1 diguanylate cyclase (GGDEF) domain-con
MNPMSVPANRRILVVDDTPAIHQDFRKILSPSAGSDDSLDDTESLLFGTPQVSRLQFQIDSAYQGEEALELVKRAQAEGQPYAMVFADMRMPPGWDGLQTIERLWEADPRLQIALCTAFSDYSWETMSERIEFDDQLLILKKPFDTLEIRQMASAMTWKWQLAQDAARKMRSLERTIEERVQELLKVSHLLQYDVLTELPNSMLLGDRLTQAMAQCRRHDRQLAVMFIGLDRFKRINNALGHPVGDEMLKRVARALATVVRESDSVFRYGSDEFVVVLGDIVDPQQTKGVADKLLAAISSPQPIDGHDLTVTASLGISVYPSDGFDAVALIKKAETAMRNVKETGPNDYRFFTEDMNRRARQQQTIESGLRLGLQRKEFVLHYQPKLDLKSGKVVGVEALVRWNRPDHGLVYPSDFIPVAEDSGLIVPLSQWVLQEACQQACRWQAQGMRPLYLSVNVSAIDFRQRGFVEGIARTLKETGLAPTQLELEITESVLMQNVDTTVAILKAIKQLGIRLAIDDFGTGYSSLSYLQKFPVDVLKIDQSFVGDLSIDSNDAKLVSTIISLGKSLNLHIIAEGVETLEQLEFLKKHHCEEVQGYYFSKAVEPQAFADWMTEWEKRQNPFS